MEEFAIERLAGYAELEREHASSHMPDVGALATERARKDGAIVRFKESIAQTSAYSACVFDSFMHSRGRPVDSRAIKPVNSGVRAPGDGKI
jgi:hypothetical protein